MLLQSLLILGIVFNILGERVLDYMRLMIRSLQLILHLAIMQVTLPANVIAFINYALKFVMFDIFFDVKIWSYTVHLVQWKYSGSNFKLNVKRWIFLQKCILRIGGHYFFFMSLFFKTYIYCFNKNFSLFIRLE